MDANARGAARVSDGVGSGPGGGAGSWAGRRRADGPTGGRHGQGTAPCLLWATAPRTEGARAAPGRGPYHGGRTEGSVLRSAGPWQ